MSRSMLWPGSGRITLAALAVLPAVLAYPWDSTRDYWLLGIAAVVVIALFGWWRGLYFTTIACRWLAMMLRRASGSKPGPAASPDTRTTVVLRIGPPADEPHDIPLALIARYLDCYGIRADTIRMTNRDSASDANQTWIGLTVSAADNLAALQARSSRIPLRETAEVAARRLADHLREIGWDAALVGPDDLPRLAPGGRETWRGIVEGDSNYVAAYRINADEGLPDTLAAIRSHPAGETWTALEIAAAGRPAAAYTVAVACALRTDTAPGAAAPLPVMTPQRGNHRPACAALDLLSAQRLDGHTDAPADVLTRLRWPTPAGSAEKIRT
jgi:type VII secretion protein EccE